ncbi:MAG: hypothetical protein JNN15_14250 [Blastocatellia bacterium]|nr:hypothetical protein [Blastocatellia bacterium]
MKKTFYHLLLFSLLILPVLNNLTPANNIIKASTLTPTLSNVTFEFDGMMGLFMGNPQRISLGIIDAHHHSPELVVYKLIGNKSEQDQEKREVARFSKEQLKRTLSVSVAAIGNLQKARIGKYISLDGRENDTQDFGWTVDIENDLYKRKLRIKEKAFWGKIHFNAGIFYANRLSEESYKFIAMDGTGRSLNFLRRVGQPATKIILQKDQELVITGLDEVLKLKAEENINYLVTVHNLPPPEMASLDHFLMYYDVIDENLVKYKPIAVKQSSGTGAGLCPPRVFGQSGLD